LLHFGRFGVARLLDLVILLLGKGDAEHAHNVSVGGATVDIGFNDTLLFLDEGAEFVASHVHAVEVEETVKSLHIFNTELDFSVTHSLIVVEVCQREFDDTPLKVVRCDFGTLCFCDDSFTTILLSEDRWGDKFVPFLLLEGVNCLLLRSLLRFGETLVLSLLQMSAKAELET
jgi:hypothetical protein